MSALNEGRGRCRGTARLLIKPVRAVIELGAANDVLTMALRAVHHANRQGAADDFIAIAFPSRRIGRDVMLPGHELELIGSEASLGTLLDLEGMQTLKRRKMIDDPQIGETFFDPGMIGAAYVRDRGCEKHTAGWIRRNQARAARRGKALGKPVRQRADDKTSIVLKYGRAVLHVREIISEFTTAPLMVSTYGLSGISAPAILPVVPDSVGEVESAA